MGTINTFEYQWIQDENTVLDYMAWDEYQQILRGEYIYNVLIDEFRKSIK